MMEKILRNTQIRNMHEMGEIERAQQHRVDEVSVQKLRENHETIQQLTSQMQEMQEQMNSMNDSGNFQEVDSNHSWRLSHVPSQPAANLSSYSMSSRDRSMPFDTWNTSGTQENVFLVIHVLCSIQEDAGTEIRGNNCGKIKADDDQPGLLCLDNTQSTLSNRLVKYRRGQEEIQNPTQRRVLKEG